MRENARSLCLVLIFVVHAESRRDVVRGLLLLAVKHRLLLSDLLAETLVLKCKLVDGVLEDCGVGRTATTEVAHRNIARLELRLLTLLRLLTHCRLVLTAKRE